MTDFTRGTPFGERLRSLPTPWGDKPSIVALIQAHVHPEVNGLLPGGENLPDEKSSADQIRFASGIKEGAFGYSKKPEERDALGLQLHQQLIELVEKPDEDALASLYTVLAKEACIGYIDSLLPLLAKESAAVRGNLRTLADWLARGAADREALKFGIAILGASRAHDEIDLLMTLGRHEEFTLYVVVALTRILPLPDGLLWELAKQTSGWGRIQTIRRLAETKDSRIKAWLLREGWRNWIMSEYSAYICATTGGLVQALEDAQVDDDVFEAATGILAALIRAYLGGPPTETLADYSDGPVALGHYVRHVRTRPPSLPALSAGSGHRARSWTRHSR